MDIDIDIDSLKQILTSSPESRPAKSIIELMKFTQNAKFFREVIEKNSTDLHYLCCQYMQYEFLSAGKFLFNFGDEGNKFFILLRGRVSVNIPVINPKRSLNSLKEVLQLGKGAAFGELALEKNKPRAASIFCLQDSHFAVLEKSDYVRLLLRFVKENQIESVIFLQSLPMFSHYTKDTIRKLFFLFKWKQYHRNQVVYKEGEDSTHVFVIKSGEFKLVKKVFVNKTSSQYQTARSLIPENLKKKEFSYAQLYILGRGEIFGEEEVLSNMPRDSSCICTTACSNVLYISKKDFITKIRSEESWNYVKNRLELKNKNKSKRLETISQIQQDEFIETLDDKEERAIPKKRSNSSFAQRMDNISRAYDLNKRSSVFRNVEREMNRIDSIPIEPPKSDSRTSSPLLHRTQRPKGHSRTLRSFDLNNLTKSGLKLPPLSTPSDIPIYSEEQFKGFSIFALTANPKVYLNI